MNELYSLADRIDDNQCKMDLLESRLKAERDPMSRSLLCKRIELQIKLIDEFLILLEGVDGTCLSHRLH